MPETPDTEVEILRAAAEELLKLKNSTGWQILMRQLGADAEQARDEFVDIDAADVPAIERCQRQVKRLRWFGETLDILIGQGFETENLEEDEVDYE